MDFTNAISIAAFPTRLELFNFLHSEHLLRHGISKHVINCLKEHLENQFNIKKDCDVAFYKDLKLFVGNLLKRWKSCRCKVNFFKTKYRAWLQGTFDMSKYMKEQPLPSRRCSTSPCTTPVMGRPAKSYLETKSRSKRRKIQSLLDKSPEELALATQAAYISKGKRNIATVIKNVIVKSPRSIKIIKKACTSTGKKGEKQAINSKYTPDEALALLVDCKLTKTQYISLRKGANLKGFKLYPPYFQVMKAKEKCYPEKIDISETTVNVDLQDLADLTTNRLVEVQKPVISQILERSDNNGTFNLIYKWGIDGSSGHSLYSQKFINPSNTDSDILQTSMVPLQLQYNTSNDSIIAWQNPRPGSTRLCRPIRFSFCKESEEKLIEEMGIVERQIDQLQPTSVVIDDKITIQVKHIFHKTMLDGKVCNVLGHNKSAQVCYICGASPKIMNDLENILKRPCKTEYFSFGLSTLHARIRFMECLLHIAYRLDTKKWRSSKGSLDQRKAIIIDKFKSEMGLLIDIVKQGKGTTNDGNTSRRFFAAPEKVSEITGIDENLIRRFAIILDTICSGYEVNSDAFKAYTLETAKEYIKLYKWYPMPASVHKILIHGADVMQSIFCPIGHFSEEALEARHKEYRTFRRHNTRKMSRDKTNEDLIHYLLFSSDPVINSVRPLPKTKKTVLSKDVLALLTVK